MLCATRCVVVAALFASLSCQTSGPDTCVTGASAACACTDGRSGAQLCGADGTFGACVCSGTTSADGGANANNPAIPKLDILLAVDNSPGMGAKQQALAEALPVFLRQLAGQADLHIGVVNSDLAAGKFAACGQHSGGRLFVKEGCGLPALEQPFLVAPPDGHNNFNGDLGTVAACLVRLGESGCGLEEQLASLATGLGSSGSFLRPDAKLLVFIDTDEDDCSVPPDSDLFVDETQRTPLTARCLIGGLQCGGQPLSAMPLTAPVASCGPRDDGKLIPVKDLVADVKSRKPAGRILVAGQIPWSPEVTTFNFSPESAGSLGFRLKAFIEAFGAEGVFNVSMEELASRTRAFLQAP